MKEAEEPVMAAAEGAQVAATWFQPKWAEEYEGLPRYSAGDDVEVWCMKMGEEGPEEVAAGKAALEGASSLLTGAAIALGTTYLLM